MDKVDLRPCSSVLGDAGGSSFNKYSRESFSLFCCDDDICQRMVAQRKNGKEKRLIKPNRVPVAFKIDVRKMGMRKERPGFRN